MNKVQRLEEELALNEQRLLVIQEASSFSLDTEYRMLLLQRSNLKDMLIGAYRELYVSSDS